jgi:hypothetical protein
VIINEDSISPMEEQKYNQDVCDFSFFQRGGVFFRLSNCYGTVFYFSIFDNNVFIIYFHFDEKKFVIIPIRE